VIKSFKKYILDKLLQIVVDKNYIRTKFAVMFINEMVYGELTCEICKKVFGKNAKKTLDHIIPKSKGGSNHLNNLQLAHKWCNHQKGDSI